MIRLSAGSAAVCGLKHLKTDALPTTAYIMDGEKCSFDCAFCPQAQSSDSKTNLLSRITWPEFDLSELESAMSKGEQKGLKRVCVQSVKEKNKNEKSVELLRQISQTTKLPICISANVNSVKQIEQLINEGADKVGISIDVCDPNSYEKIKGGSFNKRIELIIEAAKKFPERISTHIIIGLGETELQIVNLFSKLIPLKVYIGLFAFTPVKGTQLEDYSPPPLHKYRLIQALHYLMKHGCLSREQICFDREGNITNVLLSKEMIKKYLSDGKAFETSGCPDCNRPYYTEKPGGVMYNYPRPLTNEEVEQAIETVYDRIYHA